VKKKRAAGGEKKKGRGRGKLTSSLLSEKGRGVEDLEEEKKNTVRELTKGSTYRKENEESLDLQEVQGN